MDHEELYTTSETEELLPQDESIQDPKLPEKEKKSIFSLQDVYSLLHDLVYILAGITLFFVLCIRLVGVNGQSMLPTLFDNDYLALQSNVIMGKLEYGDVIVARELSFQDGEPIVKRVIATENQQVLITMGDDGYAHVYVDGALIDEPYILEDMLPYYFEQDDDGDPSQFSLTVSPGHIFVMGDNRNNSSDSRVRSIGEIKLDQVLGKVIMIVFPGGDKNCTHKDCPGNCDHWECGYDCRPRKWSRIGVIS